MDGRKKRPKAPRKRKPVKECPNPLFLKWLERWRDEAKAKESKLQYVYSKAITSLKKYPLPLESGGEATILDGIGAGIAKRLDEELVKHNRDLQSNVAFGLADDDDDIAEIDFPDMRVPPPPNMVTSPTTHVVNGTSKHSVEPKLKKKRKSSPREYIPAYRSGPYAMMIALLNASQRIGYKGYLTKAELQDQAQPHTETSFTVPEPDSYYTAWSSMSTLIKKGLVIRSGNPARFSLTDAGLDLSDKLTTATADHNTTIRSPPLSPTSPRLPHNSFSPPSTPRTRAVPQPRTPTAPRTTQSTPPSTSSATNTSPESTTHSAYGNPTKNFLASYRKKTSGTEAIAYHMGSMKFWYVGSDGECVDHQDKAAVIIDDKVQFGYLIKCQKSELSKANVKYKLDHSRQSKDGYVFVYVESESIATQSGTAESVTTKKKSNVKTSEVSNISDDSDDEMLMRPLFERLGRKKSDIEIVTQAAVRSPENPSATASVREPEIITITEFSQPIVTSRASTSISNITKPSLPTATQSIRAQVRQSQTKQPVQGSDLTTAKQPTEIKQPSQAKQPAQTKPPTKEKQTVMNGTSEASTSQLIATENICLPKESDQRKYTSEKIIIPEYELKAGSYEIILCVDFIETTGGSKTVRKEEMVKELRMNGVPFDVRKLNVGDFLWVAREIILPLPGQLVLPQRREVVLDYIVERKRMDDLCSSIKDGRFKEQKFRLLNSGLRRPVYLVEDFGSTNFLSMPVQTLEQAIVNTQVGQEFFVKRTRDIKESAAYLTLMTRYLQNLYKNQALKAIKRDDMEHVRVEENQVNTFLITFQELSDISIKNRVLTVGELFGKQLLQVPGVAVEKVVGILEHYPTLSDLLDAYEEQTTEKERENMLSNVKFGKTQRKIGPTVSKTVYRLYCTKGALS